MAPINFTKFPRVIFQDVLELLDPIEVFELSQCSKEMAKKVSKSAVTKKYCLIVNLGINRIMVDDCIFFILHDRDLRDVPTIDGTRRRALNGTRRFKDSEVPVYKQSSSIMKCYWQDVCVGMRKQHFELVTVFGCPTDTLFSNGLVPASNVYLPVFNVICTRQTQIRKIYIEGINMREVDLKRILESVEVTEYLSASVKVSNTFQCDALKFTMEAIEILYSGWITCEQFMKMDNCVLIELKNSTLTNEDVVLFFQLWMSGGFKNLGYLFITSSNFTDDFFIPGVPEPYVNENLRIRDEKIVCDKQKIIYDAVPISRSDGTMSKFRFCSKQQSVQLLV